MNQNINKMLFGTVQIDIKTANFALLLLRFYAGYTIMIAGLDKLPLKDWLVEQVITIGIPFPTLFAWIATFSEFAFGLLLVLGVMTRISAVFLAITMGVAAFGFHKVLPLVDMHITQYFFWIFILFAICGAGKFSIDYYLSISKSTKVKFIPGFIFALLLIVGFYIEFSAEPQIVDEKGQISSVSVAGSFNKWDPTTNKMSKQNEKSYKLDLKIEQAGLIEFKFTLNDSWDINFGEENQSTQGFPINGLAELDEGNNTNNIKAYIPNAGLYSITVDTETYRYSLDSTLVNK